MRSKFQQNILMNVKQKLYESTKNLDVKDKLMSQDSSNDVQSAEDFEESHSSSSKDYENSQQESDQDD